MDLIFNETELAQVAHVLTVINPKMGKAETIRTRAIASLDRSGSYVSTGGWTVSSWTDSEGRVHAKVTLTAFSVMMYLHETGALPRIPA